MLTAATRLLLLRILPRRLFLIVTLADAFVLLWSLRRTRAGGAVPQLRPATSRALRPSSRPRR